MTPDALPVTDRMVNAAIDHWPLVAALAISLWWAFPKMLRNTLSNGGGDIIRSIVRGENEHQTKGNEEKFTRIVRDAITAHEAVEANRLAMSLNAFRQEITERYELPRRRARR